MGDEANRLEELAQAEYEKFIQAHSGDGDPPEPPPSDEAKRHQRVAVLIFLILLDFVLLLQWLLTGSGETW